MPRQRLCRVCRGWHELDAWPAECHQPRVVARGNFPLPMMSLDTIEVKSMVDGLYYTSKSALRRSYRENGYVEVGNDEPAPAPPPEPKSNPEAVVNAMKRTGLWDQLSD